MEFEVLESDKGKRADAFLLEKFPSFSRSFIQNAMKKQEAYVLRGEKKIFKAGEALRLFDVVFFEIQEPKPIETVGQDVDFEIVYQDADVAVVNKPQGVVVHPCTSCKDGTLVNGLVKEIKDLSGINGELRPGIVHRIDKNTCGLLIVAKNHFAHNQLARQIANKTCRRNYLGLIEGAFKEQEGTVETLIARDRKDRKKMAAYGIGENIPGARVAITEYKTVEYFKNFSLIEFSLKTGRTHQIRVHCKYLNHPLVGDETYGGAKRFGLVGQFLCAYKISFVHPRTNEKMEFEIPLPEKFEGILNSLRKNK